MSDERGGGAWMVEKNESGKRIQCVTVERRNTKRVGKIRVLPIGFQNVFV